MSNSNHVSDEISFALDTLHTANLLTNENQLIIRQSAQPIDLADIMIELNQASLLNNLNVDALQQIGDLFYLSQILYLLNQADVLTQTNYEAILGIEDLIHFSHVLGLLSMFGLINQANFDKVKNFAQLNIISYILSELNHAQLLNQQNFDAILDPQHAVLLSIETIGLIFDNLPPYLLAANWQHILELIRRENPLRRLEQFINLLLGFYQAPERNEIIFNPPQSTHTASIHKSVSESALRLYQRYKSLLPKHSMANLLKKITREIKNVDCQQTKIIAAVNCIQRISSKNHHFIDPSSKLSSEKLLVLFFIAIRDEQLRVGLYQDALNQLVAGLYEIQRGYNLSDAGIDQGGDDLPICSAGCFNKLMEKLQGIHPDCQIIFISKESASLKLPIIVREEAFKYLSTLSLPKSRTMLLAFVSLMIQLKNEGLDVIWPHLKHLVTVRIADEFSSVYNQHTHPSIDDFVDNGRYSLLGNLNLFQESLEKSKGYQRFCSTTIWSRPFSP